VLVVSAEVAAALDDGRPVVALETSIVGQGLPAPFNLRLPTACEDAIRRKCGARDGRASSTARPAGRLVRRRPRADREGSDEVSSRDLGPVIARRAAGATTVAATMRAAAMAGIRFFATGGIGGIHRGTPRSVGRP